MSGSWSLGRNISGSWDWNIDDEHLSRRELPVFDGHTNTSNPESSIWFCKYCGIGNLKNSLFCGQDIRSGHGCGAPRYKEGE